MQIDFSHNFPEVTKSNTGTYFVKLHFPSLGFYVNGIRVVPSKRNQGEYVVYKPAIRVGDDYKTNYDYEKSCELWLYLQELALKAVDEYDDPIDIDNIDFAAELDKAVDEMEGKSL
jgi:hypothetical protein